MANPNYGAGAGADDTRDRGCWRVRLILPGVQETGSSINDEDPEVEDEEMAKSKGLEMSSPLPGERRLVQRIDPFHSERT